MSTMKKVISLMLCVAMLIGTFAIVGNVAPVASAEELSGAEILENTNIDSYESLVAQYGTNKGEDGLTDGFVYVGTEILEANGKVTDHYVKPGDVLTVRVYVKSNMYCGEPYIISLFDNTFFDVKTPAGTEGVTLKDGYTSGYTGGVKNINHPMIKQNGSGHTITSINTSKMGWVKSMCGFTDAYLAKTDAVQSNTAANIQVGQKVYTMTSDEWLLSYQVKVKEGLADGTKGVIESPDALWHKALNDKGLHDGRRKAYVPVLHITTEGITTLQQMNKTMASQLDSGALDHVILDDMNHTFTIGENPDAAKESTVKFYENDRTTILSEKKYKVVEEGEKEKVVFPETVDKQIGWAIVKEGATAPGTILKPAEDGTYEYVIDKEADVTFLRVLSIDKFPVKFGLGQNLLPGKDPVTGGPLYDITVDEKKLEEAGMKFIKEEWVIQIELPIGQPFDLATIPEGAVVKAGNEITEWDTSTVAAPSTIEGTVITLNVINGVMGTDITVSSKAIWNPELYTVNFYLNKEAAEAGEPLRTVSGITYASAVTYGGRDAETGDTYKIEDEVADKKFAGWYNVENDELVAAVDKFNYTFNEDIDVYAKWTEYKNQAVFMVRDYENGKWVEYKRFIDRADGEKAIITANEVKGVLSAACADEEITFQYLFTSDPDKVTDGNYDAITVKGVQVAQGTYFAPAIEYSGINAYYIATTLDCEVTWEAPAYDEKTNTFDAENATVILKETAKTAIYAGNGDPYAATSKLTKAPEAPIGYTLAGWKDAATGEAAEFNKDGAYVVSGKNRTATLIATYDLVKYPVAFNLRNGASPDIVMLDGTVTLGGNIEIKDAKFTLNGKASALPEVGLTNDKQPAGGYTLPEGFKFAGWTLGFGADAQAVTFPVKLTADMIRKNFANGALQVNATWEAQEYNLSFYITTVKDGKEVEELYATYKVKAGDDIANYRNVTTEIADDINEKAPVGKVFSLIWYNKETEAPDTTLTKMPAKDVAYYATYRVATVSVYIDYNYLADADLNQTLQLFKVDGVEILLYGDDIAKVREEKPYYNRSFETVVKRAPITVSPADPSEVIGWNIYHVAPGEDPKLAEWKPGVNDDGSTVATSTLIFQPIWIAHKDMLFRVYDTDGNLALGLGKNFKTYFWNAGAIVESAKDTPINKNTELYLAYILTMSIENWNWSEFFNIEMWQSLTIRFDPFPIPRSWLTWEGFKGLLEAIGNALGSLF